jgi:DNA-binding transcriptional ArsR family regulator
MNPVFTALGDPTRRAILELLGRDGPSTATQLADRVGVSRQAAAKHIDVLADAGLARRRKVGRESHVSANLEALDAVTYWIDNVRGDWKRRLDLLAGSLETDTKQP